MDLSNSYSENNSHIKKKYKFKKKYGPVVCITP